MVNPQGFKPTELSRVLYVELLTPEGRVLQSQKLKIENGQCNGLISLTEILHAGFYEVRAYTALMLNREDDPVFSRVFPIFNAPKEEGVYSNPRMVKQSHTERLPNMRAEEPKTKRINMKFFPEGGAMVKGISSTIAFKATDKLGNSLNIKGKIFNQMGDDVCQIQTSYDGMGKFNLCPNPEETYYAEVTINEDDKTYRFELPEPLEQGYTMSVNNQRNENIIIQLEHNGMADKKLTTGLTIMCRGEIVKFYPIDWKGRNTTLLNIPKKHLPEGVNKLTLFDTEGHIHAERLVFIFPKPKINISLASEKIKIMPKGKISLDFKVADNNGKPLATTFSLSVRDADTETPTNYISGGSMVTNLLLGSELRGYIHNLDQYLESDDRIHRMHLDLLLCTQGWRKYNWKEMTRPHEFKVKYPMEEGIMVMGNLTSTFRCNTFTLLIVSALVF